PEAIRRITRRFMNDPKEVRIQSSVTTRPDISQSYWMTFGARKTEALERTGYNSAALNGDMNQSLREQTLERLKNGRLDILIATDVAARGLD
ncbi:ATP-dependent RNA helicase, partial [Proteus terrae]|uniref:helicase-related protein n=1 Tax=Proteus terrae TaxID=1574161 RepID=UPI003315B538